MIMEFIEDICQVLDIEVPDISVDAAKMLTDTMLAVSNCKDICLKTDKPSPDLFFAIVHELRHIWQVKTDNEYYFSNYKTAEELSLEEYNLQPAEVDANAFAKIIMVEYFSITPLFKGMSEKVKETIEKRIEEIMEGIIL